MRTEPAEDKITLQNYENNVANLKAHVGNGNRMKMLKVFRLRILRREMAKQSVSLERSSRL